LHRQAAAGAVLRDDGSLEQALEVVPGNSTLLLAMGKVHFEAEHADKCRDVCQ
jgi:hypothetical protein